MSGMHVFLRGDLYELFKSFSDFANDFVVSLIIYPCQSLFRIAFSVDEFCNGFAICH